MVWQGVFLITACGDLPQAVGQALLHLGLLLLTHKVRGLDQLSLVALPTAACCGSGTPVSQSSVKIPVLQAQQYCLRASPHSVTCKLCSQTSSPCPWHKLQVPHLSSEVKTPSSHSDASMRTHGGCSHFLPTGFYLKGINYHRWGTGEEAKAPHLGSWKANGQIVKHSAEKKKKVSLSWPRGSPQPSHF